MIIAWTTSTCRIGRARLAVAGSAGRPVNDVAVEVAIPGIWRPTLSAVVDTLVRRDAIIAAGLPAVNPVSAETRQQCLNAIDDYGDATLISTPEETWYT